MAQLKTLCHVEDNFIIKIYVVGTMQGVLVLKKLSPFEGYQIKIELTHQAIGHCVGMLL